MLRESVRASNMAHAYATCVVSPPAVVRGFAERNIMLEKEIGASEINLEKQEAKLYRHKLRGRAIGVIAHLTGRRPCLTELN